MYFAVFFLVLASLMAGYTIGLMQKGIHIHHVKENEVPEAYNESLVKELPPEVQQYYNQTNGFNNF